MDNKTQKLIEFEEWLANYDKDDRIISSYEARDLVSQQPISQKLNSKIPTLNKLLDGFELGELVVVSGRTAHGKTLFAQTLTGNFEQDGIKCLWFSYELTVRQFLERFNPLPLFYLPKTLEGKDIKWIEYKIWEAKLKYECRAVFIDHLGFLSDVEKNKDKRSEIDSLVRKIKTLAIKHNIIIFLLWHNKKPPEGFRKYEATEDDLKESSGIAQDSDIVLMINRQEVNGDWDAGLAKINIIKSRRSGVMRKSVNLIIKNNRFEELSPALDTTKEYPDDEILKMVS